MLNFDGDENGDGMCKQTLIYFVHAMWLGPAAPGPEKALIITDRVRSMREGYVLTRVCPSVCPQRGEGYPAWSSQGVSGHVQSGGIRGY